MIKKLLNCVIIIILLLFLSIMARFCGEITSLGPDMTKQMVYGTYFKDSNVLVMKPDGEYIVYYIDKNGNGKIYNNIWDDLGGRGNIYNIVLHDYFLALNGFFFVQGGDRTYSNNTYVESTIWEISVAVTADDAFVKKSSRTDLKIIFNKQKKRWVIAKE